MGHEGARDLASASSAFSEGFLKKLEKASQFPHPGPHLQELRVLLAQLLEQCREQRWVLLNHLPHVLELGLVPQELQGVLPC